MGTKQGVPTGNRQTCRGRSRPCCCPRGMAVGPESSPCAARRSMWRPPMSLEQCHVCEAAVGPQHRGRHSGGGCGTGVARQYPAEAACWQSGAQALDLTRLTHCLQLRVWDMVCTDRRGQGPPPSAPMVGTQCAPTYWPRWSQNIQPTCNQFDSGAGRRGAGNSADRAHRPCPDQRT